MNDQKDLTLILKSHFPLAVIETLEEPRICALLERVANLEMWPIYIWSVARGLRRAGRGDDTPADKDIDAEASRELPAALTFIGKHLSFGIFVLLDAQAFLEDPVVLRLMKDFAQSGQARKRTLVLVGARVALPPELKRHSARFELALTTPATVRQIFKEELERARTMVPKLGGEQEAVNLLVQHLSGLCQDDARRLIREALFDDCTVNLADVDRALRHKHETLAAGGVLSLELDCGSFADIGGLNNLKRWLDRRRRVFLQEGEITAGLDPPRGVLLLGVQGAGKSMACKAIAGSWRVSLMRLDFAALFSKWSGETERNLRDSLKAAEAMAPCVLWIDEIEKGLAPSGGESDGGVSRRILGTLLTWMTERKSRVFLAATANDISMLPPELLRKGRFDEIFFVDLPDDATRREIFGLQFKRRKQVPESFDLVQLAERSAGFSGSEIEQAVVSALYEATAVGQPLSTAMVLEEITRTRPLSVVMSEKIAELRGWAASRTVPAN